MDLLNRSVPFVASARPDPAILLDRFECPIASFASDAPVRAKIAASISLGDLGPTTSAETAIDIATEQYEAGSEFVYGHPLWEDIRKGSCSALYAYLLETRHYLAATSLRMTPSIRRGFGLDPLTVLRAKHLLEEYDHAKFFDEALEKLGCSRDEVAAARPLPSTLEWIHFTRAVGDRDPLAAVLCSGFMEFSSRDVDAVTGWHRHVVASGLLSREANAAIFKHVETDLGFGHDKTWEEALHHAAPVSTRLFASALNDVASLCEMIYRWLSAVRNGTAALVVTGMQRTSHNGQQPDVESNAVRALGGLPVWPASILHIVNGGAPELGAISGAVVGAAYSHDSRQTHEGSSALLDAAHSIVSRLAATPPQTPVTPNSAWDVAASWLRSIDGHELWDSMLQSGSYHLVQGYILENYHYLASACRHVSAAIASCPDGDARMLMIAHLEDELEHCELLRVALETTTEVGDIVRCRPLPTTTAFVDYLRDLGASDWRAYVIASAFLQASLAEGRASGRHNRFYFEVVARTPEAEQLLAPLQRHDGVDAELGHDGQARRLLELACSRQPIMQETLERAAIVPLLSWSFLDGIHQHYRHGGAAVAQRAGWTA